MEVDFLPLQKPTFGESWCTWCCWLPHLELLTAPNKILVSLPAVARWMIRMQRKHHLVSYAPLMSLLLHLWHGVSALMARIQVLLRLVTCTKCTANRNICTGSSSVAQGNRGYHKKETSGAHFFAVFLCLYSMTALPVFWQSMWFPCSDARLTYIICNNLFALKQAIFVQHLCW